MILGFIDPSDLDLPLGGDVADYIGEGKNIKDIYEAINNAKPLLELGDIGNLNPEHGNFGQASSQSDSTLKNLAVIEVSELLKTEPPEPDQIIRDCFDAGDKVAIIGSSKMRKSFAAGQLALCLATGRRAFWLEVPKPRKVLLIQLELRDVHYHRRLHRHVKALGIGPEELAGYFFVINARGLNLTIPQIQKEAMSIRPEVIIIDPLYKLLNGDENSAEDMKPLFAAFDKLAEETGAAVVYVHHDKKGSSGDLDIRDRGAGSGILARDYDTCITLTPHVSDPDIIVVELLLRNYAPQKPQSIKWYNNCFELSDVPPKAKTSRNARRSPEIPFEELADKAKGLLRNEGKVGIESLRAYIHHNGASVRQARSVVEKMIIDGTIVVGQTKQQRCSTKYVTLATQAPVMPLQQELSTSDTHKMRKKLKVEQI